MNSKDTFAHPLLPYESRFITVGGYRMHYIDEGGEDSSKPVVLLLHGNPTWSFYYRNLIAALKDRYRVIAPDFIGLGLSDHPPYAKFRAEDRIAQVEEFVEKLGLGKLSLVMHDWGGSIGTGFAVRHPEQVDRIVYLNTTLTETEALPLMIKTAAAPYVGKILTKYTKQFLRFTTGTGLGVTKKLPKDVKDGYYLPYRTVGRRVAIWNFVDDIPFNANHPSYAAMLDLAEKLPLLKDHPVQIVWGLKDPCFHREMLNKVAAHFPNPAIYEIPEASHLVLEDAADIAIPVIQEFLDGRPQELIGSSSSGEIGCRDEEQNALAHSFSQIADRFPTEPAAIEPLFIGDSVRYGHTSYDEIADRINQYQRGFVELGMKSGDKVLMLVPPGVEFLTLSYAVMARGAIPIFIDPGMGREKLFQCISDIKPDVLIGSPRAQLLRLKKKELFPNLKFHITASDWLYTGGPKLSFLKRFSSKPLRPAKSTGTAFIAFTSGATGLPKGVVFTDEMIRAQLKIFKDTFGLQAGKKDLPLLPIFSLFQLAQGICSVFPPIDPAKPLTLAPEKILKIIHDLHIDYSFGSPTLWNKIAEYCVRSGKTLGTLQKIFMAGAPVSREVLTRVGEFLVEEGSEAYTPYGATEALPVTLVSSNEILSHKAEEAQGGECGTYVGKPVSAVELRVIETADSFDSAESFRDLPPFTIGEIVVSGANISPEYFKRPEATTKGKVQDGERLWHRMGDMGYRNEDGGVYFCGRKAHVVQSKTRTYYSVPTERIFNEFHKIKRSALVDLGDGQEPGIVVEPYPQFWPESDEQRKVFLREIEDIAREHDLTKSLRWFFFHESFPVDARHNAKIYRDQLSDWAKTQLRVDKAA